MANDDPDWTALPPPPRARSFTAASSEQPAPPEPDLPPSFSSPGTRGHQPAETRDAGRAEVEVGDDHDDDWPDVDDRPSLVEIDAQIALASRAVFWSKDLIRPGPGLLPLGSRAKARRTQRREIAAVARERRATLAGLLETRRQLASRSGAATAAADAEVPPMSAARRRTGLVAVMAVTCAVIGVAWWASSASSTPATRPAAASTLPAGTAATSTAATAATVTGDAPTATGGALGDPASAATAWMAAWCPFDARDAATTAPPSTSARGYMTSTSWDAFATQSTLPGAMTWESAVQDQAVATCTAPQALVSPEAPRSTTTAIVQVRADRTITDATGTQTVQQLVEQRVMVRDDGRWFVDIATVGG